jgi:hypothetical protein
VKDNTLTPLPGGLLFEQWVSRWWCSLFRVPSANDVQCSASSSTPEDDVTVEYVSAGYDPTADPKALSQFADVFSYVIEALIIT